MKFIQDTHVLHDFKMLCLYIRCVWFTFYLLFLECFVFGPKTVICHQMLPFLLQCFLFSILNILKSLWPPTRLSRYRLSIFNMLTFWPLSRLGACCCNKHHVWWYAFRLIAKHLFLLLVIAQINSSIKYYFRQENSV